MLIHRPPDVSLISKPLQKWLEEVYELLLKTEHASPVTFCYPNVTGSMDLADQGTDVFHLGMPTSGRLTAISVSIESPGFSDVATFSVTRNGIAVPNMSVTAVAGDLTANMVPDAGDSSQFQFDASDRIGVTISDEGAGWDASLDICATIFYVAR